MRPRDPIGAEIGFFCLNLRFGLADDGPNSWEYRKLAYPGLLGAHTSDFYAFQEANDFQITHLQDLLSDYDMIGQRMPAPDGWQNNIIFHHRRWRCIDAAHFYLSATPDTPSKFEDSQWPRQCTMGTFKRDGYKLTVVNTHFDFRSEVQRQSALLILKRLDNITAGRAVVLMGDLNAGPDANCLAEFISPTGGFKSALQGPEMGTHHNFKGEPQGPPIDWILYRGDLVRINAGMVTEQWCGIYPSDHFALTATFRAKQGA